MMRSLSISKLITVRDDLSLDRYLNEISKINLISAEREVELAVKIKNGDQLALSELVQANLRFVVSVSKQYQNQGLSLSDLINEGNLGLLKAAERFDETRGFKFISYAVWWIRQSIIQALTDNSRTVRIPLNKVNILNKIKKASEFFEQEHNRVPTSYEISKIIKVPLAEVELCFLSSRGFVSMDTPLSDDGSLNMHDIIKSDDVQNPDSPLMDASLKKDIEIVLSSLSEREADIIRLHYGLGENAPMTLHEIGQLYEITRERVRQIKEFAILSIKKSKRSDSLMKYLG